jgi:ABC-type Fe3+-hydroxamate transport system substrate-binding protein
MKTKILVIFILLLTIFLEGCVSQSSSTKAVGEKTIAMQPGEKLYYIEGCGNKGFCNSNDYVGKGIAEFAKLHNITKIEIQYDKNELATGAYVIYKE